MADARSADNQSVHSDFYTIPFQERLEHVNPTASQKFLPSYWINDSTSLFAGCGVDEFHLGVGEQIIQSITPAVEQAQNEVIIVTCFWAKSASQRSLAAALLKLADKAKAEDRLVKVKLRFSSLSLLQKLQHTSSLKGQTWPPKTWAKNFGLPDQSELCTNEASGPTGVSLQIKSVFVKPFSVMHPKFVIIDRLKVFLPSCNVSWENWFEGCVVLRQGIVWKFMQFYLSFWEPEETLGSYAKIQTDHSDLQVAHEERWEEAIGTDKAHGLHGMTSLLLPSPHNRNPRFRPSFLLSSPEPPPTPLNIFILTALDKAQQSVYMQTPNLTSPPVITAILATLERGVKVSIVTSSRMMVLEQLATAGTVTELCMRSLVKRYRKIIRSHEIRREEPRSIEEGLIKPGKLSIRYYQPRAKGGMAREEKEPVKSHLKLTIVDDYVVVLGSGNMDRASWYTSQELGVAFFSSELAHKVRLRTNKGLQERLGKELAK